MKIKFIFKEARHRFFEGGKMLESMLGFSLTLFTFVLPLLASDIVLMLSAGLGAGDTVQTICFYGVCALLIIFISMPMLMGYFGFLHSIFKGKKEISVADVFCSFASGKRYVKSIFNGLSILSRLAVGLAGPLILAFNIYFTLAKMSENILVLAIVFIISVMAFLPLYLLCMLILSPDCLGIYNMIVGVKHPYKQSRKAIKGRLLKTFALKMLFLLMTVVSILSIGSLFLVTVPIMANAYFIYAEKTTEIIND